MLTFLMNNAGNFIVGLIVALIVFRIVRSMIKDLKSGRGLCYGDCSSCGHCSHSDGSARKACRKKA